MDEEEEAVGQAWLPEVAAEAADRAVVQRKPSSALSQLQQ
jgi:hypothetical protein